jgi:hypothetical protein
MAEFHNVYVEPENFRYYQQHGNFPDGTVLVKELVLTEAGKYPDGSVDSEGVRPMTSGTRECLSGGHNFGNHGMAW